MEKMIIDKYIQEAQILYEQKELKKRLFAQKVLFTRKDNSRAFSLEDVNNYKEKTKSALVQNEIRSIAKVMEKDSYFSNTHDKSHVECSIIRYNA